MEVKTEISPNKNTIKLGLFELSILQRSVSELRNVQLTVGIDEIESPDDHVRASATLKCNPPVKFRKAVHLRIPTWFTTEEEVDVSIFTKESEGTWREVETTALTDEKFIDVNVKELSNVTAFLQNSHLSDISVQVKPYLFHNPGGSIRVGAMPSDEVVETVLADLMKGEKHALAIKDVNEVTVYIGDEIRYALSGQQLEGKVLIDKGFLQEFMNVSATYDLKAAPINASLSLQLVRMQDGVPETIQEAEYPVVMQRNEGGNLVSGVEFLGKFEADNLISSASDVYIDQRTIVKGLGRLQTQVKKDRLLFEECSGCHSNQTPAAKPAFVLNNPGYGVLFRGDVRVKNMIGNAGNVTIDQRRVRKQPGNKDTVGRDDNFETTVAVQVQGDGGQQSDGRRDSNGDQYDIDISVKNNLESMVGSDRTFTSTSEAQGQ